jgi:CRP/FNR family cyclic AMP-dependent transcriptional regulator
VPNYYSKLINCLGDARVSERVLRPFSPPLRGWRRPGVDQLFNPREKPPARTLLLANFDKETPPEPILAKINQETLAEIIGSTRSRVSQSMNKFRRLGLISYNGTIEVHPALLNVVLHEQPHIERE